MVWGFDFNVLSLKKPELGLKYVSDECFCSMHASSDASLDSCKKEMTSLAAAAAVTNSQLTFVTSEANDTADRLRDEPLHWYIIVDVLLMLLFDKMLNSYHTKQ